MALKNDRYTYRVTWSEDDNEYVGLCAEFPSLSWLALTPEAALKGIRKLVADVVKDLAETGETVPEPIAGRSYSGKFMVRVPPEVHRKPAVQAAELPSERIPRSQLVGAQRKSRGNGAAGLASELKMANSLQYKIPCSLLQGALIRRKP